MKTVARYLALSLMALLLFSCLKEEFVGGPRKIELVACMEAQEDMLPATKTYLSSLKKGIYYPYWSKGDEIGVYGEGESVPQRFTLVSGAKTATGTFEGTASGNNFIALYPYQMAGEMLDGSIPLKLPMTQNYVAGSFGKGSFPMMATGDKEFLKFRNLCALMQLSLKGTGSVLSITVTSNDKEAKLSGRATAKMGSDGIPQLTMLEGGSDTVILDCNGVELQQDKVTDFFIVVPAQLYKGGLQISINGYMDTVRHNISSDLVFERSELRRKELEVTLKGNYEDYILATERAALIDLYNSTNGDNWTNNTNWCSDLPVGEWYGVSTDGQGRVIGLNLKNNLLSGSISESFRCLSGLKVINFIGNDLYGTILDKIDGMIYMKSLFLRMNNFSGVIPESIRDLKNLEQFSLSDNNFTGTIPEGVCELISLKTFELAGNTFSGFIPKNIGKLNKLRTLNLCRNNFSGTIPESIGDLKELVNIFLQQNSFTGAIPENICDLHNLEIINAERNYLTGNIPQNIGDLTNLTVLKLADNCLTGSVPESISKLTNLEGRQGFSLDNNFLSGKVPKAVQDSDLWKYRWMRFMYGNKFRFEDYELYGPNETVNCLNGNTIDLGEEIKNNKYTILHFLTDHDQELSRVLFSQLRSIYKKYADIGVKIVGFTQHSTRELALDYVKLNGIEWDMFIYWEGENTFRYVYDTELSVFDSTGRVVYSSIFDRQVHLDTERLINLLENDFKVDKPSGLYKSTDYSSDGKVKVLQKASIGNGIDIVLMGDGYSDRLIADGTYDRIMKTAYDKLFEKEPYKSFKDYFNVYSVTVVSQNEVYVDGSNTAFECGIKENSTHIKGNDRLAMFYAVQAVGIDRVENASIAIVINDRVYAGTCYVKVPAVDGNDWAEGTTISYVPIGKDDVNFGYVLQHETAGHGFAKLADEYAYESNGRIDAHSKEHIVYEYALYGWWKNVDLTGDPAQVRWKKFLQDARYANEGLGVFEGGHTYWKGVWRPSETSIMVHNTGEFNAPSREAIYYRIHKLAYGPDWEYDYEKFVEYDAINRNKPQTKAPLVLDPQKNFRPTAPPVVVNMDVRELMNQKN